MVSVSLLSALREPRRWAVAITAVRRLVTPSEAQVLGGAQEMSPAAGWWMDQLTDDLTGSLNWGLQGSLSCELGVVMEGD